MRRSTVVFLVAFILILMTWPWLLGGKARSAVVSVVFLPHIRKAYPTPTPSTTPDMGDRPVLISPADGNALTTLAPELFWRSSGDHWYGIDIATDPAFQQVTASVSPCSYLGGAEHRTALLTNLEPARLHYWRVGYVDDLGQHVWSEAESFTTAGSGSLPRAPLPILPEKYGAVTSLRPRLTWEVVPGADMYHVTVGVNGNPFTYSILSPFSELGIPFPLLPGRYYAWRVRARNAHGWGADSETWLFTTPAN